MCAPRAALCAPAHSGAARGSLPRALQVSQLTFCTCAGDVADVTELKAHADGSFDAAIDKGTMDALMVRALSCFELFLSLRVHVRCSDVPGAVRRRDNAQHCGDGSRDAPRPAIRWCFCDGATGHAAWVTLPLATMHTPLHAAESHAGMLARSPTATPSRGCLCCAHQGCTGTSR